MKNILIIVSLMMNVVIVVICCYTWAIVSKCNPWTRSDAGIAYSGDSWSWSQLPDSSWVFLYSVEGNGFSCTKSDDGVMLTRDSESVLFKKEEGYLVPFVYRKDGSVKKL